MSFDRSNLSRGIQKSLCWLFSVFILAALAACQTASSIPQSNSSSEPMATNDVSGQPPSAGLGTEATQPTAQLPTAPSSSKPGSISGTVLDQSGAVSVGTVVRLTFNENGTTRETRTGNNGQFSFPEVPPGPFQLSTQSTGFGNGLYSGDLEPGQTFLVPPIVLSVATVVTDVRVTDDPVQVATEEVHEQIQQRVLYVVPNFFVTYHADAPPLTTKLKFQLAFKSSTDPFTLVGVGILAGLEQAGDQYGEFGQGLEGYGKRYGAGYADVVASTFLSGAVFPSLFKQDPRYFYKGTGTTKARLLHAIANSVWCRGDNGKWQVNYSNIAGIVGGASIASTMYPSKNQGAIILSSSLVRLGESSLAGFFQEFVAKKLTNLRHRDTQASGTDADPIASGSDSQKP